MPTPSPDLAGTPTATAATAFHVIMCTAACLLHAAGSATAGTRNGRDSTNYACESIPKMVSGKLQMQSPRPSSISYFVRCPTAVSPESSGLDRKHPKTSLGTGAEFTAFLHFKVLQMLTRHHTDAA